MPCYDGRTNTEDSYNSQRVRELSAMVNAFAAMCCDHCRYIESTGNSNLITGEMRKWWDGHKKWDSLRKEEK